MMKWLRQFICSLHDHAGLSPTRNPLLWKCKKCGADVNIDS